MNEEAKTGIYWAVAAVTAVIAAFVAWPTAVETETSKEIGKVLFEGFDDPLAAASMKIVTFDGEQSQLSDFEIAKDATGVWKIPTHGGYVADAEEQMKQAATLFLDNTILDVSTTNREEHAGFGVLDPTSSDVKPGVEGVGRLVTIKNEKGATLVSLIVGDEVAEQAGQRYVRRPGQDIVYAVELDDAALTTKFTDWIEDDLLQLTPFDIAEVTLMNYTSSLDLLQGSVSQDRKFDAVLELDGSEWNLAKLETFKEGTSVPRPLGENEKLNTTKLNALKQALDDLKIADVGRKPEGMSANLKASKDMLSDESAVRSLLARGFVPAGRAGSEETEILAANGEVSIGMKDGVRYILRFGNSAGLSEQEQDDASPEAGGLVGSNRYLLVTTQVDESLIPIPELQPIPETIEELDGPAATPADDAPAASDGPEMKPAEDKPAEDKPAEEKPAEEKPADDKPADEKPAEEKPADDKPADDKPAEEKPADDKPAEEKPAEEKPAEEKPAETEEPADAEEPAAVTEESSAEVGETTQEESGSGSTTGSGQDPVAAQESDDDPATSSEPTATDDDEAQPAPSEAPVAPPVADTPDASGPMVLNAADEGENAAEPAMPEETEQEKQERLDVAQERITKENRRKLDEREEKLEVARKHVAELNARFADWYYEISESTFSKLHLNLDELIIPKADAASANGPDPAAGGPPFSIPGVPGFPGAL